MRMNCEGTEIFICDKGSILLNFRLDSLHSGVRLAMTEKRPTAAFVLSLLAGIFILLSGGMRYMMSSLIGSYGGYGGMMGEYGGYGGSSWFGGMMNGYNGYNGYGSGYGYGMMRGLGFVFGLMWILGLVFGIIVIISALMLNRRPHEHTTWGILILVFSVLSAFGSMMGGFSIGVLLGLIGGILAITWKP